MGYAAACQDKFTEDQAIRMIATINSYRPDLISYENPSACCEPESDMWINTTQTIVDDMYLNGNIYINPGAQLTITSAIQFTEGKGIIVKRGAKLYLNGGILTKCPNAENWDGITVEGNSSLSQPNSSGMPTQLQSGIVLTNNNAKIEWARTAIHTHKFNDSNNDAYWGGLIDCSNTTFINNKRVAEFMQYSFSNKSKFHNCILKGDEIGKHGVTIWNTNDITFTNCTFSEMKEVAILAFDAGVKIKSGNIFHHNLIGIQSKATFPFSAYLEVGEFNTIPNSFYTNTVDIHSRATNKLDGLRIRNNIFNEFGFGVRIMGPSKFSIVANTFNTSLTCWRTGQLETNQHNYISGNNMLLYGQIYIYGENKELQILCNDFVGPLNIRLLQYSNWPGEIRELQGNQQQSAGNCFTNPVQNYDFLTSGNTTPFSYFYYSDEPCKEPISGGNYTNSPSFSENCLVMSPNPNPKYQDYINLKGQIDTIINTGGQSNNELYDLVEEKDYIVNYLLKNYIEQSELDSAFLLLDEEGTPFSLQMKYGLQVSLKNYSGALTSLASLPDSIDEMSTFKEIQYINLERLEQGLSYELSVIDSAFLENIALSDLATRAYARSLMSFLKGHEYSDDFPFLATEKSQNKLLEKAPSLVRIYPNPATTDISILIPSNIKCKSIDIITQYGDIIYNKECEGFQTLVVPVSNWQNGVYFIRLKGQKGEVIHFEKLAVHK